MKTIIIEDEEQAVSALLADLKKHCPELEVVGTTGGVEEGIELIRHSNPQLVFLDLNMPVMNGWEFLDEYEKIKSLVQKETSIYMLSSSVYNDDIKKAETYTSVKKFISKPLTLEKLENLIAAAVVRS